MYRQRRFAGAHGHISPSGFGSFGSQTSKKNIWPALQGNMTLLVWAGQSYLVQSRRQSSDIDLALLVETRRDLHKVRPTPTRINLLNNGKRLRRRRVRSTARSRRGQDSHVNRRYRNQMKVSLSRVTCMQNDRLRERRIADTRKPCRGIGEVQRRIERSGAAVISAASRQ